MIYTTRMPEPLKFQTKIVIHRWIPTEVRKFEYSQRFTHLRGGGRLLDASEDDT